MCPHGKASKPPGFTPRWSRSSRAAGPTLLPGWFGCLVPQGSPSTRRRLHGLPKETTNCFFLHCKNMPFASSPCSESNWRRASWSVGGSTPSPTSPKRLQQALPASSTPSPPDLPVQTVRSKNQNHKSFLVACETPALGELAQQSGDTPEQVKSHLRL